jgi:hypothetical protein
MELAHIRALIELLERARQRPGLYIGTLEYRHLFNYLNGIYTGFRLLGHQVDLSVMDTIAHERGWRTNTTFGAYPYMQRKGLSEGAIVREVLTIHIEGWRHIAQMLTEGSRS